MDDIANQDQQASAPSHISPFERIRQVEGEREFWAARDLAEVLGYTQWRNFEQAIGGAIRACRTRGQIATKDGANAARYQVGQMVRRSIQELGGTMPEHLPTPETSIKQLEAKERKQRRQV